jgi:hypothetical protein
LHFTYYIFLFERVSFYQFLVHVKNFAINPFLRKKQPMASTGRPYTPPPSPPSSGSPRTIPVN